MTREQYERWKDFSCRMARHGFKGMTPKRSERLAEDVSEFIGHYDWEINGAPLFEAIESWDHGKDTYVCDEHDEYFDRHIQEDRGEVKYTKYYHQLHSCIRAGLDVASEPSAGVIGFTAGDLRRMYPEGFPEWLDTDDWKAPDGSVARLSGLPDAARVWL